MTKKITIYLLITIVITATVLSFKKNTVADLTMITIKGKTIATQELRGKVVLFNFWATDCPGCIKEMPELINTYNKYKNNNFEVLAVSMYYDPPSRVITYAKNNQLPFPVILDFDKTIKNAFKNIKLTPTSILIDRNGKIINTIVGEINFNTFNKALEEELKKTI
jgi:peroxiredoxin|tara:strand:+ start:10725 stop:11219 length:495 start_codon:yes stop_codon:yes gene_type:complete